MSTTHADVRVSLFTNHSAIALVATLLVLGCGSAAAQAPELAIGSGSGTPGGTAVATISLNNGGNDAAFAQLDILFDDSVLSIAAPMADCVKDARLTDHILTAQLPETPPVPDGRRRLRVAVLDTEPPATPLLDGTLATCTFTIDGDTPFGDVDLTADRTQVAADEGIVLCGEESDPPVECGEVDGKIIVAPPTPTPTITSTATATPTDTPIPTETSTATRTSTRAESPTPTETQTSTVTRTPTIVPTASATPTPTLVPCAGDCNADNIVTVDELVRGVDITLGNQPLAVCPAFDRNRDGVVSIDELTLAVLIALDGCAVPG